MALLGNRYVWMFVGLAMIASSSCSLLDPKEPEPSWIRIDSFRLVDNPSVEEGHLSHDISDAWVFVDDELVGIFELPAEIPILEEGTHNLLIGPGIKVSTVSTMRDNYLFYKGYTERVDLIPREKLPITPVTSYRDEGNNYTYRVVEDFEDGFIDLSANVNTDAEIKRTTDPSQVEYGLGAGIIPITDTTKAAWIRTSEDFVLPQLGKVIYLEVDYYTQYDLVIGVHLNRGALSDQNTNYLTLRASESEEVEWKKAYVALTDVISSAQNLESCYIYFLPDIQTSSREEGIVLLDNIKLLYQQ